MNYYQFHVGDFRSQTRHLTTVERALYRECLDEYYETEKPLNGADFDALARRLLARTDEEKQALRAVLQEFFTLHEDGYHHNRCDEEIAKNYANRKRQWFYALTNIQRAEIQGRRNASKANATPSWLSSSHKKEIANFYAMAATLTASTGVRHEVDHIVPLRSEVVCGLHVPWNLRAIPAHENRSKSNSFMEV